MNSYKRCFAQPVYSFKIMANHIHTRPDYEQTRDSSKYQLKRYSNQEPYLFKSARICFLKNANTGTSRHPKQTSKIKMNSSTAMNSNRQETYLFKSARICFLKIPRPELVIPLFCSRTGPSKESKNHPSIPRKPFSNKNEFINGNEFHPSFHPTGRPTSTDLRTCTVLPSSRRQPQDFTEGLFKQNTALSFLPSEDSHRTL